MVKTMVSCEFSQTNQSIEIQKPRHKTCFTSPWFRLTIVDHDSPLRHAHGNQCPYLVNLVNWLLATRLEKIPMNVRNVGYPTWVLEKDPLNCNMFAELDVYESHLPTKSSQVVGKCLISIDFPYLPLRKAARNPSCVETLVSCDLPNQPEPMIPLSYLLLFGCTTCYPIIFM